MAWKMQANFYQSIVAARHCDGENWRLALSGPGSKMKTACLYICALI